MAAADKVLAALRRVSRRNGHGRGSCGYYGYVTYYSVARELTIRPTTRTFERVRRTLERLACAGRVHGDGLNYIPRRAR